MSNESGDDMSQIGTHTAYMSTKAQRTNHKSEIPFRRGCAYKSVFLNKWRTATDFQYLACQEESKSSRSRAGRDKALTPDKRALFSHWQADALNMREILTHAS